MIDVYLFDQFLNIDRQPKVLFDDLDQRILLHVARLVSIPATRNERINCVAR